MDPDYAHEYEKLFREHWWFRARSTFLARQLERLRPPGGFGAVLDVGCGNGLHFPLLCRFGAEPEGVEPDASVVTAEGRRHGAIHTVAFGPEFQPGRRYSLILMLDVLEHLEDPVAALAHAGGLLAPGGRILVTVPAFRALWTSHDERNRHVVRYRRRELRQQARSAGLEARRCHYLFGWLVPFKLAVRLIEAVAGPSRALHRVPPAPIDRLCYGLCRLEQRLWPHGVAAGGSLFAELVPSVGVAPAAAPAPAS